MPRPRLFVSAVSSELSGARRRAAAVLNRLGYDTVSEEDFPTGYGELRRWLAEQIDGCEGVIQLVGEAYGAEPPPSDDPERPWPDPRLGRCSYTQYELLDAWRRDNRTWVILMRPDFPRDRPLEALDLPPPDQPVPDPAAYQAGRRALQRAYVERLTRENHLRHGAGSETELENLLLKLKDELAVLHKRDTRRFLLLWAGGLLGLVILGLSIAWFVDWRSGKATIETAERVIKQQEITTERIRAHLREAVEEAYRRELKATEAPEDWEERERLRQAAEAQRDTQLARIDELADSFAQIERQGETTSVFRELTRILQTPGQGVTQALAYIESKRPDILGEVDRIAQSAQSRIRAKLQPLLKSAGLYRAEGTAPAARERYTEILTRAPDWPAALHDSLWFLIEQGDQAVIHGNLPDAMQDYREAQARAQRLLKLETDNTEWQRDLSVSLIKVGDIKSAQGDLAGALAAYEQSQGIRERLAAADPSNAGWQRDRSVSLERIGDIKTAQGDLAGALAAYEQDLAIAERLAAADPSNAGWQRDLYVSHWKLADLAERRVEPEEAQGHWRQAYEVLKGIRDRGLHVTPEDLGFLEQLKAKLGQQ